MMMFNGKHGIALVALIVPLLVILAAGGFYIDFLKKRYMGQYIREDGPQSHHGKAGTPTMGGLLILLGVALGVTALVVLDHTVVNRDTWIICIVTLGFGLLGAVDDYLKISRKKNKGLGRRGNDKFARERKLEDDRLPHGRTVENA